MSKFIYKNMTPFKWFVLENFPFIESDFDAINNYHLFSKVVEYLNKTIDNVNELGQLVEEFSNYFDNLDVQEEINNKLDEMAESGELGEIMNVYIQPLLNAFKETINEEMNEQTELINNQNENIENFKNATNATLNNMNLKITQSTSITPIPVSNISEMTDTTKVYLLTTDGHWYYYNGSTFVDGGLYQSMGIAPNSIDTNDIDISSLRAFFKNKEVNFFNKNNIRSGGFYNNGSWVNNADYSSSEFIPVISNIYLLKNCSSPSFYDNTKTYIGNTWTSNAIYMTVAINTSNIDLDDVSVIFNGSYQPRATFLEIIENPLSINKNLLKNIYDGKIVNLFDTNEYVTGGFYNHNNNGQFVGNAQFASTGLIPVISSVIYTNGANHRCFYDKDLNFLGASYTNEAYYMREAINITTSSVENTVVCFGGTPTSNLKFLESENISSSSKIDNKKISLVGDSMVTDGYAPWKTIFEERYNTIFNTPVGGHGGDITVFSQYVNTINTDCDIIIVWAGTNDWFHNQPMGSISDNPSYGVNVLASWKYVLEYLSTNLPSKKILALTPSPRWYRTEDTPNVNSLGENINSLGYSLRQLSDEIEKLCNLYSIPCINMMNLAGWNKNNYNIYLRDGIHQNETGGQNVANLISSFLTNLVL